MTDAPITQSEAETFAAEWYRLLDEHAPADAVAGLVDPEVEFVFPEGPTHGVAEFRGWYDGVIRLFFDEVHTLRSVEVSPGPDGTATTARVVVNWQARRWSPPAARSQWIGFDAYQTWAMIRSPATGHPVIARYVVDELRPMLGSPPL